MTIDPLLQAYVIHTNATDYSRAITLCISGTLISGKMISANRYILIQRTTNPESATPQNIEDYDRLFDQIGNPDSFMHLVEVTLQQPIGSPLSLPRETAMRVALASIDAFFFGQID